MFAFIRSVIRGAVRSPSQAELGPAPWVTVQSTQARRDQCVWHVHAASSSSPRRLHCWCGTGGHPRTRPGGARQRRTHEHRTWNRLVRVKNWREVSHCGMSVTCLPPAAVGCARAGSFIVTTVWSCGTRCHLAGPEPSARALLGPWPPARGRPACGELTRTHWLSAPCCLSGG